MFDKNLGSYKPESPVSQKLSPNRVSKVPLRISFPKENERRAAWENCTKIENECRAAWERFFGPPGPDWSTKMGPPKTLQPSDSKLFLNLFGAPPEHPSCAHQKIDQLKWTPKSARGDLTKLAFSNFCLHFLLVGVDLVTALGVPFILNICNIALVLQMFLMPSLSPSWTVER